jgi:sulfate-transporting ATPase/ATP-binding cassette subfamily B protein
LVILPVGIWLYDNNIATVMQVVMAVTLGAGMLKPLLKVSRFFMEINEVLASVRKISTILALPEGNLSGQYLENEKPVVKFCHVDFSYEQHLLLKRVNLTLSPGSFTVLLGPSGAGKTTIAQMLAGLLVPNQGNVTIGGKLVSELASEERCRLIAVATQEAFLFKGTIRENLVLARHSASDEEINQALKVSQADDLIASLPEGLDTLLQEQGIRLSGGEKQRIAIARAFLADTPVVVLDEAAASLDNLTQQAFYQDIKTHYPDKTFLVIAHRSYGVETADQIIVLEAGCITGVGNHQELIESNVFYKQLWACQTENEQWALLVSENNKNSFFIEELTNV